MYVYHHNFHCSFRKLEKDLGKHSVGRQEWLFTPCFPSDRCPYGHKHDGKQAFAAQKCLFTTTIFIAASENLKKTSVNTRSGGRSGFLPPVFLQIVASMATNTTHTSIFASTSTYTHTHTHIHTYTHTFPLSYVWLAHTHTHICKAFVDRVPFTE